MFRTRRRQLEPHSDAESFHVCPEDVYVEIDHDLRHEDESFHTAYLDFQGAQDVLRQVRVARWFYLVVIPVSTSHVAYQGAFWSFFARQRQGSWKLVNGETAPRKMRCWQVQGLDGTPKVL